MNNIIYKTKNVLRFIYNFLKVYNKNISWKILRYQQYVIEVEIDDNVKTQFKVYRNTKDGYKLTTKQIFRSREGAEMFINKNNSEISSICCFETKKIKRRNRKLKYNIYNKIKYIINYGNKSINRVYFNRCSRKPSVNIYL
jgi:hypothetical protein